MGAQGMTDYITTLEGSFALTAALTVVTALGLERLNKKVMASVRAASWWPRAMPLQKALMMNSGYPEASCDRETCVDSFAFVCLISGHHYLTGLLSVPVVACGWEGCGAVGQLCFVLSGILDVSFDIYDFAKKFALCFFPDRFKQLGAPCPLPFFLTLCVMHHTLAIAMVIPMNMKYASLRAYHHIVCSLLLAAAICFSTGQYKFTLDTSKRWEFIQFKVIVLLQAVTIWFTRGFVWFTQLYAVLAHFRAQGDTPFFYGACVAGALMSLFNLLTLADATSAALKWLPRQMPTSRRETAAFCNVAKHAPASKAARGCHGELQRRHSQM